ncbi:MAG: hypothetical protein KJO82_08220 [Gammaproteobacteria bacterium]|nr:hypothetical protein [Gammaproteobacteria bacterium]NNC76604.1 hypothetical protein [Woeseiaceae bacterium]
MNRLGISVILTAIALVSGCGGTPDRSCDDIRVYQTAVPGKRITPPEGLDALDTFKEIPLPEASPRTERPKGSPCLDLPPNILSED